MNKKNQTPFVKPDERETNWFTIDAEGKTLGRLASEIATILMGKHRVDYTPGVCCGDGVIITNCEKVVVTGAKEAQIVYRRYTGYIGGMRETPYRTMRDRKPDHIIRHAVSGMMPKTKLGKKALKRLRIFKGNEHNMQAQKPQALLGS